MPQSDPSLCDELVFSQVFRDYAETLHNYLYYKTGDTDLAGDLTQEAFIRMWNHCRDVGYETVRGYVFRTANNLLLNHYEHQKVRLKFNHYQQAQNPQEGQDPEYLLEESELRQTLEAAISALPEKQRVAFLLSRMDRKTYHEIADMLGISRQAVEKRIYNALNTLRNISPKIR